MVLSWDVFLAYLGVQYPLYVELFGVILALELAIKKGQNNIWLEFDSTLVIQALKNSSFVPWNIRRWQNCLFFCKQNHIALLSSNVYREDNFCTDSLANHVAASRVSYSWWNLVLFFVKDAFLHNRKIFIVCSHQSLVSSLSKKRKQKKLSLFSLTNLKILFSLRFTEKLLFPFYVYYAQAIFAVNRFKAAIYKLM